MRDAHEGVGAGDADLNTMMLREAQLLIAYLDSPIVSEDDAGPLAAGPRPGERAPDATGVHQDSAGFPIRLHELLRHTDHTMLLWARNESDCTAAHVLVADVGERTCGRVRSHVIVPADASIPDVSGVTFRDADGRAAGAFGIDVDTGADAPQDGSIPAY